MITRDVATLRTVVGYRQPVSTATTTGDGSEAPANLIFVTGTVWNASCGSMNGDSTANAAAGEIIDRLGLGRNYNSVNLSAFGSMEVGSSTKDTCFGSIRSWLYHSSTTCAADFDRFSTENEKARGIVVLFNTTSTEASGYMATASSTAGTFGVFTATSTLTGKAEYDAHYSLAGAGRYLRPYLFVEGYSSSSGGSFWPHVGVNLIFGDPDEAPRTTTSTAPLYKTS